jgi:hypothetical protein
VIFDVVAGHAGVGFRGCIDKNMDRGGGKVISGFAFGLGNENATLLEDVAIIERLANQDVH